MTAHPAASRGLAAPEAPRGAWAHPEGSRALPQRAGAALRIVIFTVVALAFGRLHELIPGAATLPIGKILLPLGLFALLLQPGLARRFRVLRTTQARMFALVVLAFLAWLLVQVPLWNAGAPDEPAPPSAVM
jgi:hypothetical protein